MKDRFYAGLILALKEGTWQGVVPPTKGWKWKIESDGRHTPVEIKEIRMKDG